MVDIIIPVYNARKTLPLTLMSINLQEVSFKYKVTIIDDYSTEKYDDILDYYRKYLDIDYKRLDKNGGGGVARQVGLDITNNPYIIFMDADDFFYDTDSLQNLYFEIEKGYDIVSAGEYDELKDINMINDGDLHGKIYRRKYLVDNNIRFNETRFHEDNYFNSMVY